MYRHPEHFDRFRQMDGWHRAGRLVFLFAFLALLAIAAFALLRLVRPTQRQQVVAAGPTTAPGPVTYPAQPNAPADPALEQARMRYATGTLARADYLQIVRDLGGTVPPDEPTTVTTPTAP